MSQMEHTTVDNMRCQWGFDILLADDELLNIEVLEEFLKNLDVVYRAVYNGQEGLNMLKGKGKAGHPYYQNCRLILSDINMEPINGVQFANALQKWEKEQKIDHIPIVAITANITEATKNSKSDFDDFFTKPVNRQQIEDTVNKYVKNQVKLI